MQMGVDQEHEENSQSEIAQMCSTCKLNPSVHAIVNY